MRLQLPSRLVAACAAALALVAAGCGSSADAPAPAAAAPTRVFAADNGEITIPVAPQRIVATGYAVPALIETGAPLVGISTWQRGIPLMSPEDKATYDGLEKVAGELAAETDYEAIARVDPDLIVIGVPAPILTDVDVELLESVAPVVAIGPTIPSKWREVSQRQADAAGVLPAFDALRTEYEAKAAGLEEKYAPVVGPLRFGHVGAYGEVARGTFQREFDGSWGTNVLNDLGVTYYGQVQEPGPGSRAVSEYPSMEELPASLGEADVITYSAEPDGSVREGVQQVLDSPLWPLLPAVEAGRTIPIRYTEAATYKAALTALDAADEALAPLLSPPA
ncbi:ABC transporter substrate-binding protein [Pseudonocardia kunmingensis]|uniref:Iron complex transport system substrate-binding protein n=1 Tax=Pseudonocardia kunmingensis TaxID=630975 RepID=A0A543DR05_9PSEU|nr:ABC transporter substrate-binding protein [Pseudonocardia kunmingensis]TQM11752.1 iron complex transport system substrate-binding protein [Pseudonocardia kunmingensis]